LGNRFDMPPLPSPRGEISALLLEKLPGPVGPLDPPSLPDFAAPLGDEDLQLSLYLLYELHYRGFDGVDDGWEWEPSLVALAGRLERVFEAAVREAVGPLPPAPAPEEADRALRAAAEADDGPSMSLYLSRDGTDEQMLEFMMHRSAYQLKESDPHSWAVPRLTGGPKAALVEIQADEYGAGRPERIHAEMYARSMQAVGLDPSYGAYLDRIPGVTLAPVNLMSFFGLHRRLRGATVGHLALFEITSAVPSRRYADALRRLGYEGEPPAFFDEHVEADAVHENIAAVDLAGGLIRQDPGLADDVMFGALALIELDARWARHVLESWSGGRTSLAPGTPEPVAV
jgi:hypothetical protein